MGHEASHRLVAELLQQLAQLAAGDRERIGADKRDLLHDAILECEQFLPSITILAQGPTCNLCDETDPRCLVLERLTERRPPTLWQL
jgi:hypothetical protein